MTLYLSSCGFRENAIIQTGPAVRRIPTVGRQAGRRSAPVHGLRRRESRRSEKEKGVRMRMSTLLTIATALVIGAGTVCGQSQDTLSVSAKIDSIYRLQKKMYRESKNEPLAGKNSGMEFNFIRFLTMEKSVSLSGGFSLFSPDRRAEIAFPLYFSDPDDPEDLKEWTVDCHYRFFLGNTQNGFYLSGFTRFAHLSGYLSKENEDLFEDAPLTKKGTENKLGVGFGLGYRKFSYRGLYWGASFSVGRYIVGENERFYGKWLSYDDDEKIIYDFELLKFGWAF
jgi:hypothetical protein